MKSTAVILLLAVQALAFWPIYADQSITLAWNPVPEPSVSGYKIWYGNRSRYEIGGYNYVTNVGNVTTATVWGLAEATNWFFAVTAHSESGLESDYSRELTNWIPTQIAPPGGFTNWLNVTSRHVVITINVGN